MIKAITANFTYYLYISCCRIMKEPTVKLTLYKVMKVLNFTCCIDYSTSLWQRIQWTHPRSHVNNVLCTCIGWLHCCIILLGFQSVWGGNGCGSFTHTVPGFLWTNDNDRWTDQLLYPLRIYTCRVIMCFQVGCHWGKKKNTLSHHPSLFPSFPFFLSLKFLWGGGGGGGFGGGRTPPPDETLIIFSDLNTEHEIL